jgi:AcrR family transcriptional regulator
VSTVVEAPVRARRTQAERSASTRTRLLEATLRCLDELGYARTSTPEIARRAGVSRGAQLHHFPTKAELVTSAVEHLFRRRHEEFLAAFAAVPPGEDPLAAAIDILWGMVSGPSFHAWVEIAVAARTDPELHAHVAQLTRRFADMVDETFRRLFAGGAPDDPFYAAAPAFAFALLDGLAMQRLVLGDDRAAAPVLAALKSVARLTLPAVPRP